MEMIERDSEEYRKRRRHLLETSAPEIYQCKKCGSPVIVGYCCYFCGDSDPSSTDYTTNLTNRMKG